MFDELHLDRALVGERQRTFSACFDDARFDERPFIERVLAATGASSHRVFPSDSGLWADLPALVAQMDEPFHSTSQYSQYCVMRLVRDQGVTVTLDGQGADELMAGYPTYHSVMIATLARAAQPRAAAREAPPPGRNSGRGQNGPRPLPPNPGGQNGGKSPGLANLAGRMPLNGQVGILRRHALPVIFDRDQLLPAELHKDRDA